MIVVDRMLIGGLRFVLDKVAAAADRELNDVERLREQLLEAQMRAELGEIEEAELAAIEREVMERMRALQEARGEPAVSMDPTTMRVSGVEVSVFEGDERDGES